MTGFFHIAALGVAIGTIGMVTAIALGLPAEVRYLAFLGAALGGASMTWAFGHRGLGGWVRALFGAVLATVTGAAIAGSLFGMAFAATPNDVLNTAGLGVTVVLGGLGDEPMVGLTWLTMFVALQLASSWLGSRRQVRA